jgi:hypothetical protein
MGASTEPYPDMRDFQAFLGELLERNEAPRQRYLGWLGSSLTAIALLAWLLLDILEHSPRESQTAAVGLVLLSLVFFMLDFVDSILKGGLGGLFSKVTAPWERDAAEETVAERKARVAFTAANLKAIRQRSVLIVAGDVLLNSSLFVVFLTTYSVLPEPARVALVVWIVRLIVTGVTLAGFLATMNKEVLELVQKSQPVAPALTGGVKVLVVLLRVGQGTGRVSLGAKVVFYSVLVFAGYWLLTQYGSPPWIAVRLTIIAFAVAVLARFALNAWTQVKYLGEENRAWGEIRADILLRRLETTKAVEQAMNDRGRRIQERRLLPFKVPTPTKGEAPQELTPEEEQRG